MALGPHLNIEGMVLLVVSLDPVHRIGGEPATCGDNQHVNPGRMPQSHLLTEAGDVLDGYGSLEPMFALNDDSLTKSTAKSIER